MDFEISPEQAALMETVKSFVDERIEPRMREIEQTNEMPEDILVEASELGLFGVSIPEAYGGSALNWLTRVLIHQMIGRSGFGFSGVIAAHTGIGSHGLVELGTEEQKQRYLPRMATGELRASFAITEHKAGSDAGGIKTYAEKKGDRYVLNGVKCYISGGSKAGLITVIARTNQGKGNKKFSVFLVEPSFPGFRIGETFETMGTKGQPICELVFEDCQVPEGNRLGEEGKGWVAAMKILNNGRTLVASRCVGACERLLEISAEHARERRQFDKPIGAFQGIQFMLADMATRTEAARWLTYKAANDIDNGKTTPTSNSMAKLYASETLAFVADSALQIQGGAGYMSDNPVNRFFRDARITRIYEGTSEIQRMIIGRALTRQ